MSIVIAFIIIVVICFSMVLLYGAPYLPSLRSQIKLALKLAQLKEGDTLLELGCGDGKVVIAAARLGLNVVGYELNPFLALIAWLRTRKYKHHVKIVWSNFWKAPWPEANAIYVFLLPRYMNKLDKKCVHYPYKPIKLISFAFAVPGKQPVRQTKGLYLYKYE